MQELFHIQVWIGNDTLPSKVTRIARFWNIAQRSLLHDNILSLWSMQLGCCGSRNAKSSK